MEHEELKKALASKNFYEALRVAVADLINNENLAPFTGLAVGNTAEVGIRRDGSNNLRFYVVEQPELPKPTEELPEPEPPTPEPEPKEEIKKPRKRKAVRT